MRTDGVHALGVDITHWNYWITLVHVWKNQIVCGRFKSKKEGIRWIITRSWIHQTNCFRLKPKFTLYDPFRKQNSPSLFVKFRHYKVVLTYCYSMIISVAKKKFFNSIWPVLKSISLREIIAFFHSFVSVSYLIFYHFFFVLLYFLISPLQILRGFRGEPFFFFLWKMSIDKHLNFFNRVSRLSRDCFSFALF